MYLIEKTAFTHVPVEQINEVQRTLYRAIDILEHNHWVRGKHEVRRPTGEWAYCLDGVLNMAAKVEVDGVLTYTNAASAVSRTLQTRLGLGMGFIQWNDSVARTKEEVVDLLKEAVRRAA